ncbi:complex I NDUFA9 subunit family protein [Oryzibacter oryziterrae]|uniref:complex I NDUFA9 subunit family protein n=1 Tax=Oryzibacter oryziterrae TaxID=2766474 RepID=UPI001F3B1ABC|nr:complex I NDUFA9 subunit family protein [Oryzibacter oryziterrae]
MTLISDAPRLVTVFGGSGFIGRHVVRALAQRGYRVRVAVRRPDLAFHLQPLGTVGQITPVQANLRYKTSVDHAVAGSDAVVNLVGIMTASGRQTHAAVQAFGARAVAEACKASGVTTLVHMSATASDANSASAYARTKFAGEAAVLEVMPNAIVLRPSAVFGPEDKFFNLFASMAAVAPALPLIGGGKTLFQPVYVEDVAEAIARAVDGKVAGGKVYELGGPDELSLRDCMERVLRETGRKRALINLPFPLATLLARLTGWLPGAPLTVDQVELLKSPSVVSHAAIAEKRTFEAFGIKPKSLDAVLPTYLYRYLPHGQYDRRNRMA